MSLCLIGKCRRIDRSINGVSPRRRAVTADVLFSRSIVPRPGDNDNAPDWFYDEYFREVLLSYRLIFGQSTRSWKAFKRNRSARPNSHEALQKNDSASKDPLLRRLCGSRWKNEQALYASLEAEEAPNHYSPAMDFPILSDKLLRLQRFSKEQHPHDLKLLWSDRRDARQFYTFWAVLWIGSATILLALLQAALTAWQIALAYESNALAAEQNRLQALQVSMMR